MGIIEFNTNVDFSPAREENTFMSVIAVHICLQTACIIQFQS